MEKSEQTLVEWWNSLTLGDAGGFFLIVAFALTILILVVRTFRNKPSA